MKSAFDQIKNYVGPIRGERISGELVLGAHAPSYQRGLLRSRFVDLYSRTRNLMGKSPASNCPLLNTLVDQVSLDV